MWAGSKEIVMPSIKEKKSFERAAVSELSGAGEPPSETARSHTHVPADLRVARDDGETASGDEQASAHVLLALRVEVPQVLELCAQIIGKPIHPGVVDLNEVAGRIANVQLHDITGQFNQMIAEGIVVKRSSPLSHAVHRLDVINGDAEVMMAGGLEIAFKQVQLRSPERQPLDRDPEVRRRHRLGGEQVDVEVDRLAQVARVDTDVVDLRPHSAVDPYPAWTGSYGFPTEESQHGRGRCSGIVHGSTGHGA